MQAAQVKIGRDYYLFTRNGSAKTQAAVVIDAHGRRNGRQSFVVPSKMVIEFFVPEGYSLRSKSRMGANGRREDVTLQDIGNSECIATESYSGGSTCPDYTLRKAVGRHLQSGDGKTWGSSTG